MITSKKSSPAGVTNTFAPLRNNSLKRRHCIKKIILPRRYTFKGCILIKFWLLFVFLFLFLFNSQILKTSNSFHRQFAKQISSAVVTSDLFAVWYPGLCSKCHLIRGSFSGNRADPQKAHIQLKPTVALQTLNKRNEKTQSLRFKD